MNVVTLRLAVIGDPVAHSRSPELHRGFLAQADIPGTYEAIQVPAGRCAAAVADLRERGYLGCNVTTPLKEEAFALCHQLDDTARRSESVNTLSFFADRIVGANTDGLGALAALRAAGCEPRNKAVLILGVGPTARAACVAFLDVGAFPIVWNRTPQRAEALAARFSIKRFTSEEMVDAVFATLPPEAELPEEIARVVRSAPVVVDANYGPRAMLSQRIGRVIPDGSTMLYAQARASFERWCTQFGASFTPEE